MSVAVKICGLTNRDDAMFALEHGADFIGFVLFSGSLRGISGMKLCRILDEIDVDRKPVAVFVNEKREEIEKIAADCNLHAVQLHGDEDPNLFSDMNAPVWRAVKVQDGIYIPDPVGWTAERYVLDAAVPGEYGGTGVIADWEKAAVLAGEYPVMIAGGLTPGNVKEAIRIVQPMGVDASSGLEKKAGLKDHGKVKKFIAAVRDAEQYEFATRQ